MMMMLVINHDQKNNNTGGTVMTISLSAHISEESREKLKLYQDTNGFHNVSDALEDALKKMPKPVPAKKEREPDPNQTTFPECLS